MLRAQVAVQLHVVDSVDTQAGLFAEQMLQWQHVQAADLSVVHYALDPIKHVLVFAYRHVAMDAQAAVITITHLLTLLLKNQITAGVTCGQANQEVQNTAVHLE